MVSRTAAVVSVMGIEVRVPRYLGKGIKITSNGIHEQRRSFESIIVVVIKRVMVNEEVDLADAVTQDIQSSGVERQNKKVQGTQR